MNPLAQEFSRRDFVTRIGGLSTAVLTAANRKTDAAEPESPPDLSPQDNFAARGEVPGP